jgi:hypothetical protein
MFRAGWSNPLQFHPHALPGFRRSVDADCQAASFVKHSRGRFHPNVLHVRAQDRGVNPIEWKAPPAQAANVFEVLSTFERESQTRILVAFAPPGPNARRHRRSNWFHTPTRGENLVNRRGAPKYGRNANRLGRIGRSLKLKPNTVGTMDSKRRRCVARSTPPFQTRLDSHAVFKLGAVKRG